MVRRGQDSLIASGDKIWEAVVHKIDPKFVYFPCGACGWALMFICNRLLPVQYKGVLIGHLVDKLTIVMSSQTGITDESQDLKMLTWEV